MRPAKARVSLRNSAIKIHVCRRSIIVIRSFSLLIVHVEYLATPLAASPPALTANLSFVSPTHPSRNILGFSPTKHIHERVHLPYNSIRQFRPEWSDMHVQQIIEMISIPPSIHTGAVWAAPVRSCLSFLNLSAARFRLGIDVSC